MKASLTSLLAITTLLFSLSSLSKVEIREFQTPQAEEDYHQLIQELRCLVCQNQNLADSNAELAQDLRQQTFEMVNQGQSRQQIVDYMVQRYGDFVLYRPPFKTTTLLLWLGPFMILAVGLFAVLRFVRQQRHEKAEPDAAQLQRAHDLLTDKDNRL